MAFRGRQSQPQQWQESKIPSGDDYCSYVTKMEKKTSMIEGPHFPQLHSVFKQKEVLEEQEKPRPGLFGRPRQKEWFEKTETYEISETTSGDFIRRK